jgi:phage terminase large subunit-like protein
MEEWKKAQIAYTEDELVGLPCWAGLDLARKHDMTSLVFVFQRDKEYLLLPKFWLPEVKADEWAHLASYRDWAKAGELTLTEGSVAHFEPIEEEIVKLFEKFKPRNVAFDDEYAEEITQRIHKRTGVTRIDFPQTMMTFTGPTTAFERMLALGTLKHNGHRLLSWQAGNVQVKVETGNQNIRPVKGERGSHKSIDGIVAGIMALARALQEKSVYEDRGMIEL